MTSSPMRRVAILAAMLALAVPTGAARASTPVSADDLVVAMIDTGVYAQHEAFDYRGKDSRDDQFVAWWDFSDDVGWVMEPRPGQLWDPRVADPYDPNGHGTGTAAMAVGRNGFWSDQSYAPGFKLAVAKVGGYGGITGSITSAIRWAVDTVRARVINISIGISIPTLQVDHADVYAALRHARRAGVLVVVSNGNGLLNSAIPGNPGWARPYSSSPDVLAVGASDYDGVTANTDPEVAARYRVVTACTWDPHCYTETAGTSFSSPTVAGMAAAVMQVAVDHGRSMPVDWFERLLKFSAEGSVFPPNVEGYGVLDDYSFAAAYYGAMTGRLPERPIPDPDAIYVDGAGATLRDAWSNKLSRAFVEAGPSVSDHGEIGPSTPMLADGEVYTLTLQPGQSVVIEMWFWSPEADIEMRLFPATGVFDDSRLIAKSTRPAGQYETITFTSPSGGSYRLLVHGYTVPRAVQFWVAAWSWNGPHVRERFAGQSTYAVTFP